MNDRTQPPESPDIRGAISHSLKAAASLVGDSKVVDWFAKLTGDIVQDLMPIDAGGFLRSKGEKKAAAVIESLLK